MRVVDMHCDTISRLLGLRREGKAESLRENTGHLDLLRMRQGNYLLQNFALFVDLGEGRNPWEEVCALYDCYREELETLRSRRKELTERKNLVHDRLIRAFPAIREGDRKPLIEKLRSFEKKDKK